MSKNKLKEMKAYIQDREGWDLEELIEDTVQETNLLHSKRLNAEVGFDECSIKWGKDYICGLDEFIQDYTEKLLEKVCNVIDSYIKEE